jgi:hypothetical protein
MVEEAHRQNRTDFLKRAYRFADWCRQQKSKDLWNSVGVSFYKHLFDEKSMRPLVIPWLHPEVMRDHWASGSFDCSRKTVTLTIGRTRSPDCDALARRSQQTGQRSLQLAPEECKGGCQT